MAGGVRGPRQRQRVAEGAGATVQSGPHQSPRGATPGPLQGDHSVQAAGGIPRLLQPAGASPHVPEQRPRADPEGAGGPAEDGI